MNRKVLAPTIMLRIKFLAMFLFAMHQASNKDSEDDAAPIDIKDMYIKLNGFVSKSEDTIISRKSEKNNDEFIKEAVNVIGHKSFIEELFYKTMLAKLVNEQEVELVRSDSDIARLIAIVFPHLKDKKETEALDTIVSSDILKVCADTMHQKRFKVTGFVKRLKMLNQHFIDKVGETNIERAVYENYKENSKKLYTRISVLAISKNFTGYN